MSSPSECLDNINEMMMTHEEGSIASSMIKYKKKYKKFIAIKKNYKFRSMLELGSPISTASVTFQNETNFKDFETADIAPCDSSSACFT